MAITVNEHRPHVTRGPLNAGTGPTGLVYGDVVDFLVRAEPAPTADEWRQRLLDRLANIERMGERPEGYAWVAGDRRQMAANALIDYLDDPEITAAYERAVGS